MKAKKLNQEWRRGNRAWVLKQLVTKKGTVNERLLRQFLEINVQAADNALRFAARIVL